MGTGHLGTVHMDMVKKGTGHMDIVHIDLGLYLKFSIIKNTLNFDL